MKPRLTLWQRTRAQLAETSTATVLIAAITMLGLESCAAAPIESASTAPPTVADTLTQAKAPDGMFISWREHLIDAEDVNGGIPIRGGDGIALADLDQDGYPDFVTAQEDSNHLRVAFGSDDPDQWALRTIAEGSMVAAIEDVAAGDLNGDGWPDIVAACEEAHLAYFENPGPDARDHEWKSLIIPLSKDRGSWLRIFIADINGDGTPDLTAANKGTADLVRSESGTPDSHPTSLITLQGPPLDPASWNEQVLYSHDVPNTALPFDFNGDGRLDVLAAERLKARMVIILNDGTDANGKLITSTWPINIAAPFGAPDGWHGAANAFQADIADLNQDGRPDLVVSVRESVEGEPLTLPSVLGWLEQPGSLAQPWIYHRIGDTLPDPAIGIHLADIDGDGDLDVLSGGYSGLNVLAGTYSGAARDHDDESVTAASSVGRIAWFENPGEAVGAWTRHDISRRVRGMYDMFLMRDMDGDGDLDIVAPRGNSGQYDGLFWLEQIRSPAPRPAFTPARKSESKPLPLPPADWISVYNRAETYIAPNKVK